MCSSGLAVLHFGLEKIRASKFQGFRVSQEGVRGRKAMKTRVKKNLIQSYYGCARGFGGSSHMWPDQHSQTLKSLGEIPELGNIIHHDTNLELILFDGRMCGTETKYR